MRIKGLFRYPLKSGAGECLSQALLDGLGIVGDRRFMFVRASDGRYLSQRGNSFSPGMPEMAMLSATIEGQGLRLSYPGQEELLINAAGPETEEIKATLGESPELQVSAFSTQADEWGSRIFGLPVRLVRMGANYSRELTRRWASGAQQVAFPDAYPLLLITEASLAELSRRHGSAVPVANFRPNVLIEGDFLPFEEDKWKRIRLGRLKFEVVKPCARCVIITTDQQNGRRSPEILKTLASFRSSLHGGKKQVFFGENLLQERAGEEDPGELRLGDEVEVLEYRSPAEQIQFLS